MYGPRPDRGRYYFSKAKALPRSFFNMSWDCGNLCDESPMDWLHTFWTGYVEVAKSKRLCMWKDNKYLWLPYIYRGHRIYRQKQDDKIERLADHWPTDGAVLLTISPRRTGSPFKTLCDIKSNLNRFFSWLRRKKHGNRCCYIWAVEGGQSGNAHIHIALATKWVAPIDDICQWWQGRGIDIQRQGIDVRRARSISEVQSYVLKYVTKSNKDILFTALLYLTGSRQWGGSFRLMGLFPRPKTNSNTNEEKWIYVGCFDLAFLEMMFGHCDGPPNSDDLKELWNRGRGPLHQPLTGMESRRHRGTLS